MIDIEDITFGKKSMRLHFYFVTQPNYWLNKLL